jgi:general secretion pathway protein G
VLKTLKTLKTLRNDEGFTLIELLIVIIILAILAAIVVFAVGTTTKNASVSSCNADAKSVETALESYKAQKAASFPALGGVWAAGTYTSNYAVLTTPDGAGNRWLRQQPGLSHYTILWDSSGHVWVNGANDYTGYPAGPPPGGTVDFDLNPGTACNVAS